MSSRPQPAKKSYLFGKGYTDLANTVKGAWALNRASMGKYAGNMKQARFKGGVARGFQMMLNLLAIVAVAIVGSAITAVFSLLNAAVLTVALAAGYLCLAVVRLADRLYLYWGRIFSPCYECKEKSLIPTYICPRCGAQHTDLTPGAYGIFKRTCQCGEKLPSVFFNGRKKLKAVCPVCGHVLNGRESRPVCIPVAGGRSVGKTAFITAFSREFIETVAPGKSFSITPYDEEKAAIYEEIKRDFASGSTRITAAPGSADRPSAVSFSFFARHPRLRLDRMIHIYDIAGEVFTHNRENELQRQYEYCHGIVLMADPFSIPSVRLRRREQLTEEDEAGIGLADLNEVVNAFLLKLRQVTGLSERKQSVVPVAVVIGKIDSAGLEQELGEEAVRQLMSQKPETFKDPNDTQDYLCRRFLIDNGMAGFVNNINIQFKNNRFFACTAIGHSRDRGAYEPRGVMTPMEWLFQCADPRMARLWSDTRFSKRPAYAAMLRKKAGRRAQ